ncbi:MAG: HAMP domain-containing sensor histidine kinase [Bacillota bacterium]
MIKKFKMKYYFTVFLVIFLVFVAMIVSLNVMTSSVTKSTIESRIATLLSMQSRQDAPPSGGSPNAGGNSDSSSFGGMGNIGIGQGEIQSAGNIMIEISVADSSVQVWYNSLTQTDEEIYEIALSVMESGKTEGNVGSYYYAQLTTESNIYYAITDASQEIALKNSMQQNSIIVFIIAVILVACVALFLSSWSIKPIDDAMQKQKQFISDASHELKTPLSVISINSEIIKRDSGESQWCDAIISETVRMNELVNDMLSLSQLDEGCVFEKLDFDLSNTIDSVGLLLEVFAYEKGKELKCEIEPNIKIHGVESKIKQLAIILIENAVKNSLDESEIILSLKKSSAHITLEVSNVGETIPKETQLHLFDRFYRADNSRNLETGGFGLGLCIAKSITDLHKAKISVSSEEGNTCFKVVFKSN